MLNDSLGRKFSYLRISITEKCNFRCEYCLPDGYQGEYDAPFLTLSEIRVLVATFAQLGVKKIRITGGEPSLRRDLNEIIRICKTTPGIEKVALTTHGARLGALVEDWVDAGLDQVNVSIDSLNPAQFKQITGHDKLPTILIGIDKALSLGLPVKVNSVLLKSFSEQQFAQFLAWIEHKPITLRFIELMQTGNHVGFFVENHWSAATIQGQLETWGWQRVAREVHDGPALEYSHPDYKGKIGLIMPYADSFCDTCNRLRISAIGQLHLCLFSESGIDLRPMLKAGNSAALMAFVQEQLRGKAPSHLLQQGKTGATKHLAMIGG